MRKAETKLNLPALLTGSDYALTLCRCVRVGRYFARLSVAASTHVQTGKGNICHSVEFFGTPPCTAFSQVLNGATERPRAPSHNGPRPIL
jgi:hypothetical protein